MTNSMKTLAVSLLALVLPVTVAAQQPNAPAQAANNAGDQGRDHHRFMILHALNKAIDGSGLQFAARVASGDRQRNNQGQDADNNQRDRNADNNQRDRNADNNQRDDDQNRQRDQRANQQIADQLEQQARQEFAATNQLLDAAGNDIQSGEGTARSEDPAVWTRRLHAAAKQYSSNLRSLSGVRDRDDRESGSGGNRSDSDRDAQQRQRLNRGDVARVFLINHAVRQAGEAYHLNQMSNRQQANNADTRGGSAQQLQERARKLETDSTQILQRVQASFSANQQDNDDNRRSNQGNQDQNKNQNQEQNKNQNQNQNQQGRGSVRELAQQAQQLIDTLQRINANEPRGR